VSAPSVDELDEDGTIEAGAALARRAAGGGKRPGIWQLAWPSMASFGLQSLVHLVDFVIVGSLGTEAVAAVGVAAQFFNVLFAVLAAVTTGTVALIARAAGAGDTDEAERILRISLWLGSAFALVVSGLIPLADAIVAAFGVNENVVRIGASYLRIQLCFTLPFAIGFVLASALRGAGDVRTPLALGVAMNVVNVIGNYGLVFGALGMPRLGTDGSALASGIAFSANAALSLVLWRRGSLVLGARAAMDGRTWARVLRVLRIGVPTALEQMAWQAGLWLFLRLVAHYGTEPVSAYLIGVRILSFSFVPGLGFSAAAATLVGQHLGAGEPDLAARSGWRANRLAMIVMAVVGACIIAAAPGIASYFGAAGARTVALTVTFIWILGIAQPLMAVEFALGGALRGAGDTRFPLLSILTGLFVFRLGGALLVTRVFQGGVVAVYACLLADYVVKATLLATRFRSGRWRHVSV
jgi:putative MATE family efflux protein